MRPGRKGPGKISWQAANVAATYASMRPGRKGPGKAAAETPRKRPPVASMRPGRKGPGKAGKIVAGLATLGMLQ